MAKLGSVITQVRGVSYSPKDLHDSLNDESIILLRANNIKDGKINFDDVVYVDKKKVNKNQYIHYGDILICTSSGSKELVGKAAFFTDNTIATFGAFCKVIRPSIPCKEFIGHFFNSPFYRKKISSLSSGANINNIRNEHIDNLEINLPTENIQEAITLRLNLVNSLIESRQTQLSKLDQLVKSRFVEMFGECKTNPKNWKLLNMEEIADVGSSKRVFVEELQEEGIPFYRGTEVGALAEGKSIEPELYITEEHYKKLVKATGIPQLGDLLMPSICPDGRIWVVNTENPFYFKDGRVLWIHNIDTKFNSTFLLYSLKDRIMTDYLSIASGTTFAELKIFTLKKCKIFSVPLPLQEQFADFVQQVDKVKSSIKQSLEKLETLKKSLMQEYFG